MAGRRPAACKVTNQELNMTTQAHVLLYHTAMCPYCVRAERLLEAKGVTDIEKIRVDLDPDQRVVMMERTGRRTVPQIYIGATHVGGFDDLYALEQAGKLDA